jgi:ankyrin repeat protein
MRELTAALLRAGADINVQDERGNTALHYAARKNTEFFIQDLITAGADMEIRNKATPP